ncbi:MAG TPA: 50S ribosomal protein L6 [Gemmataceae bacterium]|nr:50S ribosomal protein L6 [Gemmataceae bacterium]
MSRIGKQPVVIPAGVKVRVADGKVVVEGPKATKPLEHTFPRSLRVTFDDKTKVINVERPNDERENRALHGLTRSLIANMVEGVTKGFTKRLNVVGIGYQARVEKNSIVLTVGYANPITLQPPDGVTVTVPSEKETKPIDGLPAMTVIVTGADKQKVGQFAAEIRHVRPPEPYKGKGIRYENEQVRRKEGKSFTSGG